MITFRIPAELLHLLRLLNECMTEVHQNRDQRNTGEILSISIVSTETEAHVPNLVFIVCVRPVVKTQQPIPRVHASQRPPLY